MNLNQNPTLKQLKELFATADDEAGHHILCVDGAGTVSLVLLPDGMPPDGFQQRMDSMKRKRPVIPS